MPRRRAGSLSANVLQTIRHRRSPLIPFLAFFILCTLCLFYFGYSHQQSSLRAIQKTIPPRPKPKLESNLLPPDPDLDDEDEDVNNNSNGESSPAEATSAPLEGWRPRKGLNGEDLGLSGISPDGVNPKPPPPSKPYAYIQLVNHPRHVCSALMTLARLRDLHTLGALVLLYPRDWDSDHSLGLARGLREQHLKFLLQEVVRHMKPKEKEGAAAPTWVKGEYRPPQDQNLIFPNSWPEESHASRWEKTARRLLLSAVTRYGVQLIPIDPLPSNAFSLSYTQEDDPDALPPEIHLPLSGSLSPTTYARSQTKPKLTSALTRVITPLHLFNLTQYSRIVYLSPLGLPMKNLDKLVTSLPPGTRIATPRNYWPPGNPRDKPHAFSAHFWVMTPSRKVFSTLLTHVPHTQLFESWLGTVTPRTTVGELESVAVTGGWHGLGAALDLANEVLEDVFGPSSALVLPPHPWHVPVFEDEYPTSEGGRRHGGLLGKWGRWDRERVKKETHFAVWTGGRRPWESWGGVGGELGEWEWEWLREYAGVRRDVCLLDLETGSGG